MYVYIIIHNTCAYMHESIIGLEHAYAHATCELQLQSFPHCTTSLVIHTNVINTFLSALIITRDASLLTLRMHTHTQDTNSGMENSDTIEINGSLPNGKLGSTSPDVSIEIRDGKPPMRKVKTISFLPTVSVENSEGVVMENGIHSQSTCTSGSVEGDADSLSPPAFMVGSMMTPSRKSMEALKKVGSCGKGECEREG